MEPQDTITIAPSVLLTIVQHATEEVKGVARMAEVPVNVGRLLRGANQQAGVVLDIEEGAVLLDLYIMVKPNVSMSEVGREVQHAVKRAIHELVGMEVRAVNVHIEDVDYSAA